MPVKRFVAGSTVFYDVDGSLYVDEKSARTLVDQPNSFAPHLAVGLEPVVPLPAVAAELISITPRRRAEAALTNLLSSLLSGCPFSVVDPPPRAQSQLGRNLQLPVPTPPTTATAPSPPPREPDSAHQQQQAFHQSRLPPPTKKRSARSDDGGSEGSSTGISSKKNSSSVEESVSSEGNAQANPPNEKEVDVVEFTEARRTVEGRTVCVLRVDPSKDSEHALFREFSPFGPITALCFFSIENHARRKRAQRTLFLPRMSAHRGWTPWIRKQLNRLFPNSLTNVRCDQRENVFAEFRDRNDARVAIKKIADLRYRGERVTPEMALDEFDPEQLGLVEFKNRTDARRAVAKFERSPVGQRWKVELARTNFEIVAGTKVLRSQKSERRKIYLPVTNTGPNFTASGTGANGTPLSYAARLQQAPSPPMPPPTTEPKGVSPPPAGGGLPPRRPVPVRKGVPHTTGPPPGHHHLQNHHGHSTTAHNGALSSPPPPAQQDDDNPANGSLTVGHLGLHIADPTPPVNTLSRPHPPIENSEPRPLQPTVGAPPQRRPQPPYGQAGDRPHGREPALPPGTAASQRWHPRGAREPPPQGGGSPPDDADELLALAISQHRAEPADAPSPPDPPRPPSGPSAGALQAKGGHPAEAGPRRGGIDDFGEALLPQGLLHHSQNPPAPSSDQRDGQADDLLLLASSSHHTQMAVGGPPNVAPPGAHRRHFAKHHEAGGGSTRSLLQHHAHLTHPAQAPHHTQAPGHQYVHHPGHASQAHRHLRHQAPHSGGGAAYYRGERPQQWQMAPSHHHPTMVQQPVRLYATQVSSWPPNQQYATRNHF